MGRSKSYTTIGVEKREKIGRDVKDYAMTGQKGCNMHKEEFEKSLKRGVRGGGAKGAKSDVNSSRLIDEGGDDLGRRGKISIFSLILSFIKANLWISNGFGRGYTRIPIFEGKLKFLKKKGYVIPTEPPRGDSLSLYVPEEEVPAYVTEADDAFFSTEEIGQNPSDPSGLY